MNMGMGMGSNWGENGMGPSYDGTDGMMGGMGSSVEMMTGHMHMQSGQYMPSQMPMQCVAATSFPFQLMSQPPHALSRPRPGALHTSA